MKKSLLLLAFATLAPFTLHAQANGQPHPPAAIPGGPSPAVEPVLKRFNLDFPGGTPGALAAAISKAMGRHLNLIIPASHADTKIMPMKVESVTVPDLFRAIQTASARQVPVVTGSTSRSGTMPAQRSFQYKTVEISFIPTSGTVTDETVWSFGSTEPTAEDSAVLAKGEEPEQVCQYFQLAPYLQDHTVEDITTAIQTGWKMLKVDPVPQLSFHQETKLLIAVGSSEQVAQIPMVLQQLRLDDSTAVEKIAKWQAGLAEIEEKKAGDWQKQALEMRQKIADLAKAQKARETIRNPPAGPVLPPVIRNVQ